jgi:beta-phosphoglucomutase-like phosphatase (HAD superfamily)
VAIEDSDNGVRSAYAAGMTVIQVPNLAEPAEDVRSLGHLVLNSLRDVERYLDLP